LARPVNSKKVAWAKRVSTNLSKPSNKREKYLFSSLTGLSAGS